MHGDNNNQVIPTDILDATDNTRRTPTTNQIETKVSVEISTVRNELDRTVASIGGRKKPVLPGDDNFDFEDYDIQFEYSEPDNGLNDNLIPNDRGASFANIVQATVVETSARSVRDPSIGSKYN